jgi:hypothetical protein
MTAPISKQTLQSFLFDQGYADVRAPDQFYALTTEAWIAGPFADALRKEQEERGAHRYAPAKNNCTKFSGHAKWYAGHCHYLTTDPATENAALAFGTFDFERPDGTAHSINIAVTRGEDLNLWLVYFEPQTACVVPEPVRRGGSQCVVVF